MNGLLLKSTVHPLFTHYSPLFTTIHHYSLQANMWQVHMRHMSEAGEGLWVIWRGNHPPQPKTIGEQEWGGEVVPRELLKLAIHAAAY